MYVHKETFMGLEYTEWKKGITMDTVGCVAFSSTAEKDDVGLCVFQHPATGVDVFHLSV
jgi:hypothetical protein